MTKLRSFVTNFALIVLGVVGLLLALAGFSIGFCLLGRLITYALVCLQAAVGGLIMGFIMFGALSMFFIIAVAAIYTSK